MKRLLLISLILGGCQATNLSTSVNSENGSNAVTTNAIASTGGLSTYGSGSVSNLSNIGGGNSGQIQSAGSFGGEAGGGSSEGGLEP